MTDSSVTATFLFTDIEGSSRLWEREPAKMQGALAAHDRAGRAVVEAGGGHVVKMTGDGMCAVFDDPLAAVHAVVAFQQALADLGRTTGLELRARCGLHVGVAQPRDRDYYGTTVNRAARIMSAAHGGQVLLSQAVVDLVRGRLPESISLRDLGLVRLRDLASPERLYQLAHPALRQDFAALRSLEVTPNNLPQQATSFIGREVELDEARKALGKSRLLMLVGAGGIGKTRLSLQLAADVMDDYPDGVWFVELAPITDGRLVPQAVATALGVKEESGLPVTDAIVRAVVDKRMLVVLDNCEHLLADCAALAERLLRSAHDVKLLGSSREPLRIGGEVTYAVPPLAVPDPATAHGYTDIARSPAVRLFVDRASAAVPTARLSEDDVRTIADICRHLDGIPLAIELAAARVRALPLRTIAERLDDRFRLLTGGNRTALPRQQTLRALIDWSHDLLSAPERTLFRRLAVFAGGCTMAGAEAVCAGGKLAAADILDSLVGLVDKSLVAADTRTGRYRLLETIRQYAEERLRESEEREAVCERHLDYYLAFAESAEANLYGPEQSTWLARLDVERENLLAAHEWCDVAPDGGAKGIRLVNAVKGYFFSRGLLRLARRAMAEALGRPGAERRDRARSAALFGAGQLSSFAGDYSAAIAYLEESVGIARELADSSRIAAALQPLGFAELGRGNVAAARRHFEEGLALARAVDDPHQLAAALNAVAQLRRIEGDLAGAEALYDQGVALGRRLGDPDLVAVGLLNVAMVYILRSAYGSARLALQEVIAIADETQSMPVGQSALEVAAGLAAATGDADLALRLFGAAEANTHLTGIARDPTDDAFLQPLIAGARNAKGAAEAAAAERSGRDAGYQRALGEVRAWLNRAR